MLITCTVQVFNSCPFEGFQIIYTVLSYYCYFYILGALSVDITDKNIESAISNLKLNSGNFQTNNVKVLELEWGVTDLSLFHAPYDIILATDVIYIESSFSSLLQTLWELSSNKTLILLSCKRRYDRDDRFFELSKKQFKYEVIMQWTKSDNVTIYRLLKNSQKSIMPL